MRTTFGRDLSLVVFSALALSACTGEGPDGEPPEEEVHDLVNGGKADGLSLSFLLSDESPSIRLRVRCDQPAGCEGYVEVQVVDPEPCALLEGTHRPGPPSFECGPGMEPAEATVASLALSSRTEGERELPLRIETGDGLYFATSISAAFTIESGETVTFALTRAAGAAPLDVDISADWQAIRRTEPGAAELEAFLSSIEGLDFWETGTEYAGYRSYVLDYEQPLDHGSPAAGSFRQRIVLHHRDREAPMVLYTSGYQLFAQDYLSELGELLGANQISTEQRFFGTSVPDDLTAESWVYVDIEQAANDHHRIVEALRPFYEGTWIGTGHSKGGMTSIYHRRFFPDDVEVTVPYVAPISFSAPDPRYEPFLDQIGTDECRETMRALQRAALERFDVLQPRAEAEATSWGWTFERTGGHAASFEFAITQMDWGFWQAEGLASCDWLPDATTLDDDALYAQVVQRAGYGVPDQSYEADTYWYQASSQLGYQTFSTAAFGDLLRYADTPRNFAPTGTSPVHDPSAMEDIQAWVLEHASEFLFVYGEHDPWTGGRFATDPDGWIADVTARGANHAAMIRDLEGEDRDLALLAIELWTDIAPSLTPRWRPSHAPRPPRLLYEGGFGRPSTFSP